MQIRAIPPGIAVVCALPAQNPSFYCVIQQNIQAGKVWQADDSKPEDRPEPFLALQGQAALPPIHAQGTAMNTSAVAQATPSAHAFTQEARDAIYHAIFSRRDVRGQFCPRRCRTRCSAASSPRRTTRPRWASCSPGTSWWCDRRTPSAGCRVPSPRPTPKRLVCSRATSAPRTRSLKLEGIMESPIGICITCDRDAPAPWWWGVPT